MSLLPTFADIKNTITRLGAGVLVRIYSQSNGSTVECDNVDAIRFFGAYTLEVLHVSKEYIILRNAGGTKYTVTFHKRVLTQIPLDEL